MNSIKLVKVKHPTRIKHRKPSWYNGLEVRDALTSRNGRRQLRFAKYQAQKRHIQECSKI